MGGCIFTFPGLEEECCSIEPRRLPALFVSHTWLVQLSAIQSKGIAATVGPLLSFERRRRHNRTEILGQCTNYKTAAAKRIFSLSKRVRVAERKSCHSLFSETNLLRNNDILKLRFAFVSNLIISVVIRFVLDRFQLDMAAGISWEKQRCRFFGISTQFISN